MTAQPITEAQAHQLRAILVIHDALAKAGDA